MELFLNFQTTLQNVSAASGLGIGVLITILVLAAIGLIALCVAAVLILKRIFSAQRAEEIPEEVIVAIAAAYHQMQLDAGISDSLVAAIAGAYHSRETGYVNGVTDTVAAAIALSYHTLKTAR